MLDPQKTKNKALIPDTPPSKLAMCPRCGVVGTLVWETKPGSNVSEISVSGCQCQYQYLIPKN